LGHSGTVTFQTAPSRPDDVKAISSSYLARIPGNDALAILVYGVKSNSSVATIGDTNVVGPGRILGSRMVITLPSQEGFFHTISAGLDYKHFDETVRQSASGFSSPVTYYPVVTNYTATWQREGAQTQLNAGVTSGLRGIGSEPPAFDDKRFKATTSFVYFR